MTARGHADRVEERRGVGRQVGDPVAAVRTLRLAEAALIEGKRAVAIEATSGSTRLNENQESGQPWRKRIAGPAGSPDSA